MKKQLVDEQDQIDPVRELSERIKTHHLNGCQQISKKEHTDALLNLRQAFQLAHNSGNPSLPAIAYDFGIAAMYVIRKASLLPGGEKRSGGGGGGGARGPAAGKRAVGRAASLNLSGNEPQTAMVKGLDLESALDERRDFNGSAREYGGEDDEDEDGDEKKNSPNRFKFWNRSSSYSKFDSALKSSLLNEEKDKEKDKEKEKTAVQPKPTRSTFSGGKPTPLNMALIKNSTISPPVTPPIQQATFKQLGVSSTDLNTAASALCYLLRLLTTKQNLAESQRQTSGLVKYNQPHPDGETEEITFISKKAELCFMISEIYRNIGQTFLADEYAKQAKNHAKSYRELLSLPEEIDIFPLFDV